MKDIWQLTKELRVGVRANQQALEQGGLTQFERGFREGAIYQAELMLLELPYVKPQGETLVYNWFIEKYWWVILVMIAVCNDEFKQKFIYEKKA